MQKQQITCPATNNICTTGYCTEHVCSIKEVGKHSVNGTYQSTPTPQQAQYDYCRRERIPHFAPLDAWCFNCDQYIYGPGQSPSGYPTAGISPEQAGTSHVMRCPHCSTSYCD